MDICLHMERPGEADIEDSDGQCCHYYGAHVYLSIVCSAHSKSLPVALSSHKNGAQVTHTLK